MFIVEVIPIIKQIRTNSLTYFSSNDISAGTLVSIELRKKIIKALVISSKKAELEKQDLKSKKFALKKIKGVSKRTFFQKQFLESAEDVSKYNCSTIGAVLSHGISSKVLKDLNNLEPLKKEIPKNLNPEISERYVIQDTLFDRYSTYKSIIRTSFAKKKSVFFICPTEEDVRYTKEELSKGIEERVFTFKSSMNTTSIRKKWNKSLDHKQSILIICTPKFLCLPRHDIGSIIIEQESSDVYVTRQSPYIDTRKIAEFYASKINATLYLGDHALRTETLERFDKGTFLEEGVLKFRNLTQAETLLIDMKKDRSNSGETFRILSNEVRKLLEKSKENNELTFLYAARKGLSPTITCADCGTLVTCNTCESPMVLYGKDPTEENNFFRCHSCGEKRGAAEKCSYCDSWRLKMLGIGVETVEAELKDKIPDSNILILDSTRAKNPREARKIVGEFYSTPGSVLIGTEMALYYLKKPIHNIAITSLDSLFSIPHYAIREKVIRTILRLRSLATKTFYVSTRKIEDRIFEQARQGNLADFYRDEFTDRKKFGYPPFSTLIKIAIASQDLYKAKESIKELEALVDPYKILIYRSPNTIKIRNKQMYIMNGLIKVPKENWPDEKLRRKLLTLPPQYKIVVNPQSII